MQLRLLSEKVTYSSVFVIKLINIKAFDIIRSNYVSCVHIKRHAALKQIENTSG